MFYTPEIFQAEIEALAAQHQSSYLDSIMIFCEDKGVEVEDLVKLISPFLKDKLFQEGVQLGLLKKESTLKQLFN